MKVEVGMYPCVKKLFLTDNPLEGVGDCAQNGQGKVLLRSCHDTCGGANAKRRSGWREREEEKRKMAAHAFVYVRLATPHVNNLNYNQWIDMDFRGCSTCCWRIAKMHGGNVKSCTWGEEEELEKRQAGMWTHFFWHCTMRWGDASQVGCLLRLMVAMAMAANMTVIISISAGLGFPPVLLES